MSQRKQWVSLGLVCFALGLLASQSGSLVYSQGKGSKAADIKPPKWQHGLNVLVRKGDEDNFTDKTRKYGIEVFRDENNGNVIYISETGSIAVVPGK